MTRPCQARPDRYEPATMRCAKCGLAWDREDLEPPVCGLVAPLIPETVPYASALPFVDRCK